VYDALDAETWTIAIGVVLGFFAVPAAMYAYDVRRGLRKPRSPSPHDLHGSGISAPRPLDALEAPTTDDDKKAG